MNRVRLTGTSYTSEPHPTIPHARVIRKLNMYLGFVVKSRPSGWKTGGESFATLAEAANYLDGLTVGRR